MARTGRPRIVFNWPMIELCVEAGSTEKEIAEEYRCDPDTLSHAIKKKYKMNFSAFSAWRHSRGRKNLRLARYKKVKEGNVQVILHLSKHWFKECDYELERTIKEEHENKNVVQDQRSMASIEESCKKLVEKDGPIAEPRPNGNNNE